MWALRGCVSQETASSQLLTIGRKEALQPHREEPQVWKKDGGSTPCLPCLTGPFRFEALWCRDFLSLLVFKAPLRMEP